MALDALTAGNGDIHRGHPGEKSLKILPEILPLRNRNVNEVIPKLVPLDIPKLRDIKIAAQSSRQGQELNTGKAALAIGHYKLKLHAELHDIIEDLIHIRPPIHEFLRLLQQQFADGV